jgi:UDP-N-acetyl-D-mannosaminuronate dehydrogenase
MKRIQDRTFYLTIVGSGQVGVPTTVLFADVCFTVTATDVKPTIVKTVNGGLIQSMNTIYKD